MPVAKFSASIAAVGVTACTLMAGTILTTYLLCVHKQECPALPHLPTISNTWTHPPGSYISRWVVGNVAMLMGLGQFAIFWIDEGKSASSPKPKILPVKTNRTLLIVGFVSCVCLSIVGAICDDAKLASCRGNNTYHSTAAVIFFVGYDAMMSVIALDKKGEWATLFERSCIIVSVLSKSRWAFQGNLGDETPLAIFEWSNVAVIMLWTVVTFSRKGKGLRLAIVDQSDQASAPFSVLSSFSASFVANLSLCICVGTLASTLFFAEHQGRIPHGHVPYISDLFVYPPGDWISRWALVAGATLVSFDHIVLYFARTSSSSSSRGSGSSSSKSSSGPAIEAGLAALACVSMFGLSVVGCVNESEDLTIHSIAAVTFFAGYDLYMVLTLIDIAMLTNSNSNSNRGADSTEPKLEQGGSGSGSGSGSDRRLLAVLCLACLISLASKARFCLSLVDGRPALDLQAALFASGTCDAFPLDGLGSNVAEILEWTDALAIISFYYALMWGTDSKRHFSLSLIFITEGGSGAEMATMGTPLLGAAAPVALLGSRR